MNSTLGHWFETPNMDQKAIHSAGMCTLPSSVHALDTENSAPVSLHLLLYFWWSYQDPIFAMHHFYFLKCFFLYHMQKNSIYHHAELVEKPSLPWVSVL